MNRTVILPNRLCFSIEDSESVITQLIRNSHVPPLTCDLKNITFIRPYAAMQLFMLCAYMFEKTGRRVKFVNIQRDVHAYLERMDFFKFTYSPIVDRPIAQDYKLSRIPSSSNVSEITRLSCTDTLSRFTARSHMILSTWLNDSNTHVQTIVDILAEIGTNVLEHSGRYGYGMIQRYVHRRPPKFVEVHVVIGDLGHGIQGSLQKRYSHLAQDDVAYIELALEGKTAKAREGGAGLLKIQRRIEQIGNQLAIRSGSGLILAGGDRPMQKMQGYYLPGTQVSVKLRSKI